jgi:hypothetical protein
LTVFVAETVARISTVPEILSPFLTEQSILMSAAEAKLNKAPRRAVEKITLFIEVLV